MTEPNRGRWRIGALIPFTDVELVHPKPAGASVDVTLLAWGRTTKRRGRRA
ncbi:MAG: hypothetical protein AAGI70_08025 [Pseudomonadota bacterium]